MPSQQLRHPCRRPADITRFSEIAALPGFNLAATLPNRSVGSSTLFSRDPIDASSSQLRDSFIRRNLRYLAPEIAGSRRPSSVGDIFSFGVMAYELLTGSTIDGGHDSPEAADIALLIDIHRHLTIDIIPPSDYLRREAAIGAFKPAMPPSQLSDIIMKCLEKNIDERYSSFDSLAYASPGSLRFAGRAVDLDKFTVSEVDHWSRFALPRKPIHREAEIEALDRAFNSTQSYSTPRWFVTTDHSSLIYKR